MSKTRDTGFLGNVVKVDSNGDISLMHGSTMLMQISSSGAITTTGVISGSNALSASYAVNTSYLNNSGSGEFVPTGSFNAFSSSILTYTGSVNSQLSSLQAQTGSYATTGSNIFIGNQTITGSILGSGSLSINGCIVSTGQIVAQTINVQQVTSSVVYSCGSNIFGCAVTDTQQMTGSLRVTGSNALFNVGCIGINTSTPSSGRLEIQETTCKPGLWVQTGGTTTSYCIASFRTGTNLAALEIYGNGTSVFGNNICANVNSNTFGSSNSFGRAVIIQAGCTNQAIQLKNCSGGDGTISATGGATSMNYSFGTYQCSDVLFIANNGNIGIGIVTPQSALHMKGHITFSENGYDSVRLHTITHSHSDGSACSNYIAFNVSDGAGVGEVTRERMRINGAGALLVYNLTCTCGAVSSEDVRIYRSAGTTTGYINFGSTGTNYFGFDGSKYVANGAISATNYVGNTICLSSGFVGGSNKFIFANSANTINAITYDTFVIQADDVTTLKLVERNVGSVDQVFTMAVGDSNARLSTTCGLPMQFFVNGNPNACGYNGLSGMVALSILSTGTSCFACNVCSAGTFFSNVGATTSTYGFTHCGAGRWGRFGMPNTSFLYLETNADSGIYLDAQTRVGGNFCSSGQLRGDNLCATSYTFGGSLICASNVRIGNHGYNTGYVNDGIWGSGATPSYIIGTGYSSGFYLGYLDNGSGLYGAAYGFSVRCTDGANNKVQYDAIRMRNAESGAVPFYVTNYGNIYGTSKNFRIDHPIPSMKDTHYLVHTSIEGPQADLIYRGKVQLVDGKAEVNIDEASRMTNGTFEALCQDVQSYTTNESGWSLTKSYVVGNILHIEAQDTTSIDTISWLVIGERKDDALKNSNTTDENNHIIVELLKPEE